MCGIAGVFAFSSEAPPPGAGVVERLNQRQRSRGPDGAGVWTSEDERICLGHRRLAIIDTGAAGAQPMMDASGRWVVTFNGEIYNYRALRLELEALGRVFHSNSDTEILINCIDAWGEEALGKLRGMFAFGLWDRREKELWLARDPFGIKPLYWSRAGSNLYFASRARALAECAPVDAGRNSAGLVGYYLWGFVPEPFTWWEGVQALPAGSLLRIRLDGGVGDPKPFANIADLYQMSRAGGLSQEELRNSLVESVEHHFVADVPVGVFLSAGIDSTAIATLASQAGYDLRTVTLAFDEFAGTDHDEAPLAEETARLLGADHTTVRIGRNEFLDHLENFLACMDQPSTDGLNTYLVSHAAASIGLKVALSGLGGDELFGGYPSFDQIPRAVGFLRRLPARAAIGKVLQSVGSPVCRALGVSPKYAAAMNYCGSIESAYLLRRCLHTPEDLERLLDETWTRPGLERLASAAPKTRARGCGGSKLSDHAEISRLEIENYMRNQPLRDTDWASMAHSIEVRTPFLDMPLLARMAPAMNSARPPGKADLARCAGDAAARLIERRKTGFTTPVGGWTRDAIQRGRGLHSWASFVASHYRTRVTRSAPGASLPRPARA